MIALYPGAFKPPHRGHFNVVKSLLDGTYNGAVYDKDSYKDVGPKVLQQDIKDKPKIDKVIVFSGGGERNGISKEESFHIFPEGTVVSEAINLGLNKLLLCSFITYLSESLA